MSDWKPHWRQCKTSGNAIWTLNCDKQGDEVRVRVPWSRRHDSAGWPRGEKSRVRYRHEGREYSGLHVSSGDEGITVLSHDGKVHRLKHGRYTHSAGAKPQDPKAATGTKQDKAAPTGTKQDKAAPTSTKQDKAAPTGTDLLKAAWGELILLVKGEDPPTAERFQDSKKGAQKPSKLIDRVRGAAARQDAAKAKGGGAEGIPGAKKAAPDKSREVSKGKGGKYPALKPGQRWITVHPNGSDEKGVPILLDPEPDGSFRVVGGAGGKLNHLILTGVKSESEYKAKAKAKREAKKAAEKERRAAMTPDERKAERAEKTARKQAVTAAERKFIDDVQNRMGGVDDELPEEELDKLSPSVRHKKERSHHRKRLRQAQKRVREVSDQLVEEGIRSPEMAEAIRSALDERPEVLAEAQEMAQEVMDAVAVEKAAREANRASTTRRKLNPGVSALVEAAEDALDNLESLEGELGEVPEESETVTELPSVATKQEARAHIEQARLLQQIATGEADITDDGVREAMKDAGVYSLDDLDDDEVQDNLRAAAVAATDRALTSMAQSSRFEALEGAGEVEKAEQIKAHRDTMQRMAKAMKDEVAATGLNDLEKVPIRRYELAELVEVMRSEKSLRREKQALAGTVKEAEKGQYRDTRKAWDMEVKAVGGDAARTYQEELIRRTTENLLGLAARGDNSFLQSHANGAFDGLADIQLGADGHRHLSRDVVDAVGLRNSALLTRYALEKGCHDRRKVLRALEDTHVERVMSKAQEAIRAANEYVPGLSETVTDVGSIEKALQLVDAHERQLVEAERAVGATLGSLEATAALGQAFRSSRMPDSLDVSIPENESIETGISWMHAVGLRPGEYQVSEEDGVRKITVAKEHWDKLLTPVDQEAVDRRRTVNAIKAGKEDEDGWMPQGFAKRTPTSFNMPAKEAPRFWEPVGGVDSLEDHIGARVASGEGLDSIARDLISADVLKQVSDRDGHLDKVRDLLPLYDDEGKPRPLSELGPLAEGYASAYLKGQGREGEGYHSQDIGVDRPQTREAVFRTLSKHPEAVAAFKGISDLTGDERRVIRSKFYDMAGIDPKVRVDEGKFKAELEALGPEPSKTGGTQSLFGGGGPSAEWQDYQRQVDQLVKRYPRAGLADAMKRATTDEQKADLLKAAREAPTAWARYVQAHGSLPNAIASIQDAMRGEFVETYVSNQSTVGEQGLIRGTAKLTGDQAHAKFMASPEERADMLSSLQRTQAQLRGRTAGKFAAEGEGAVSAKYQRHLEAQETYSAAQAGLFGMAPPKPESKPKDIKLGHGERWSIGARAEAQLASVIQTVGSGVEARDNFEVFPANMDGDRIAQQRGIKALMESKRMVLAWGTGSGKTPGSLGAFTEAHARGDTKHGLFSVPSAGGKMARQFRGEALSFLEPGKFSVVTSEGKSHEERLALLTNPNDLTIMTHQATRDTVLKAMADKYADGDIARMKRDLINTDLQTTAKWWADLREELGVPKFFTAVDEFHGITDRGEPSGIAAIHQMISHPLNTTHWAGLSATPIKNEEAEVWSTAQLVDPDKYSSRNEFMRTYGHDLAHGYEGIRRELSDRVHSVKINPAGVERQRFENPMIQDGRKVAGHPQGVELQPEHRKLVDQVKADFKMLSSVVKEDREPNSAEERAALERFGGERALRALGTAKENAMRKAIYSAPREHNTILRSMADVIEHDVNNGKWELHDKKGKPTGEMKTGKPSIIFVDRHADADLITEELKARGIESAYLSGRSNADANDKSLQAFKSGQIPTLIVSPAGEAGINIAEGRATHHYGIPMTAKSHTQREGRAYRQKARGDVDAHDWWTATEFDRNARARLQRKSSLADIFEQPIGSADEQGFAARYAAELAEKHESTDLTHLAA